MTEVHQLLRIADQCVKCGQCLSVCPTYNLFKNEVESPRGRITLMQGLLKQQLGAEDLTALTHLDHCLYCGNCESVCPSGVEYLNLLDNCKQLYPASSVPRWQLELLTNRQVSRAGQKILRFFPDSLRNLLPDIFQNAISLQTPERKLHTSEILPSKPSKGKIGFFTGCIGYDLDYPAIQLTSSLLQQCGYEVLIPQQQVCCGAMFQHEGYPDKARHLQQTNWQVFNEAGIEQILFFSSGCGSYLTKEQIDLSMPVSEATQFIASLEEISRFRASINDKIAIHMPCTLKNTGDSWNAMHGLVSAIAGDKLVELPGNNSCCGSAGLNQLKYPEVAQQLLEPKLKALEEIAPDILLTSNAGCSLHFYNGIIHSEMEISVMHPAEWISQLILQDKR